MSVPKLERAGSRNMPVYYQAPTPSQHSGHESPLRILNCGRKGGQQDEQKESPLDLLGFLPPGSKQGRRPVVKNSRDAHKPLTSDLLLWICIYPQRAPSPPPGLCRGCSLPSTVYTECLLWHFLPYSKLQIYFPPQNTLLM